MITETEFNKAMADYLSIRAKYLYGWAGMDLCEVKDSRDDLLAALHVLGVWAAEINDEVSAMVASAKAAEATEVSSDMDQERE
jgi:hypothetical protein